MDVSVQVISSEKVETLLKQMEDEDVYTIKSSPRGKFVIFNNESFSKGENRLGSKYDEINLASIAQKLDFDVKTYTNKTAAEIKSELEALGKDDYTGQDALIVAIMSHGRKDVVLGCDGKPVEIDRQIVPIFDGKNCPSLSGKPKIFIFQACQGSKKEVGVLEADEVVDNVDVAVSQPMAGISLEGSGEGSEMSTDASLIPHTADIVKSCATVKDFVSWRNMKTGSWFIRAIVSVFSEFAHEEDLITMLQRVNKKVSEKSTSEKKYIQMPCIGDNTLRKKFYFMPGYSQKQ